MKKRKSTSHHLFILKKVETELSNHQEIRDNTFHWKEVGYHQIQKYLFCTTNTLSSFISIFIVISGFSNLTFVKIHEELQISSLVYFKNNHQSNLSASTEEKSCFQLLSTLTTKVFQTILSKNKSFTSSNRFSRFIKSFSITSKTE